MPSNQSAGVYVHGEQILDLVHPVHGGLVPVHGGLSPIHGSNNSGALALSTYNPFIWLSPADTTAIYKDNGVTLAASGDTVQRATLTGTGVAPNTAYGTQGTAGQRPLLTTLGGKRCFSFDGVDDNFILGNGGFMTVNQPFTIAFAARIRNGAASQGDVFAGTTFNVVLVGSDGSNDMRLYAGASGNYGVRDGNIHTYIATFNGAASALMIDGVESGALNPGVAGLSGYFFIGANGARFFLGELFDMLVIPSALSSGTKSNLRASLAANAGI